MKKCLPHKFVPKWRGAVRYAPPRNPYTLLMLRNNAVHIYDLAGITSTSLVKIAQDLLYLPHLLQIHVAGFHIFSMMVFCAPQLASLSIYLSISVTRLPLCARVASSLVSLWVFNAFEFALQTRAFLV